MIKYHAAVKHLQVSNKSLLCTVTRALSSNGDPAVSKEKHLKNLIFMAKERIKSTERGSEVQKHFILPSAIFLRKQNKTKSACFKTHSKGF